MAKNNNSKKVEEVKEEKSVVHSYLLLVVLFVATIGLVLYLCKWYNVYDEYQKETPIIRGALSEIIYDDLEHYILDNPTTVIYMCTAQDDTCRSFEKSFKRLLKNKDYNDEIIYLNLSGLNQEEVVATFNEKYKNKVGLTTNYPALVYFEDGRVKSILQGKENKKLSIVKVKQFLDLNDIGEN